ncbi:DUF1801 domain-containing protein [Corynebacterium lubricantis]|uniref:DUF1801 domain-containing protein n=1 Tax=Corynebacterium lubricantis TaxID=541095 RepID=UPI0003662683|nr:DUF1801 domain-containing protein [Corynebacterium lubricantis]
MTAFEELKGVGRPARDAFALAGYPDLESLDGVPWATVLDLHGVGQRGLERVQAALQERGLSMQGAPEPRERVNEFTAGATGKSDSKTAITGVDPRDYIDSIEGRRKEHGHILLDVYGRATGVAPAMWGPTMIGYGEMHYKYETGREGDMFIVGFSPRKAKLSLYGIEPVPELGKYTSAVSCTYVNKPEDIDLEVLERLVREAWEKGPDAC